ncbi:MAG: hypothetical protein AAFR93_12810 [Pseudomonadota bacterium]
MQTFKRLGLILCLAGTAPVAHGQTVQNAALDPGTAQVLGPVVRAANAEFRRMPVVILTSRLDALCGGGTVASLLVRYCTDLNTIFVPQGLVARAGGPDHARYVLAHAYGHAAQVRHGVADLALAAIRRAPAAQEGALRAAVTRQVECVAGVVLVRATVGEVPALGDLYAVEPMQDAHWGRTPLAMGPKVSIGLEARAQWLRIGATQGLDACAVGPIPVAPLLAGRAF